MISDADIKKLRVDNLRAELKKRVLGRGGLKGYLVKRLHQAIIENVPIKNDQATEVANTNVFAAGAYWKVLDPENTDINEPTTSTNFHKPKVGNDEVTVAKKRNYARVFDRAPFVGTVEVDKLNRYKRRRVNPVIKKVLREVTPIGEHGAPRPDLIFENRFGGDIMQHEWFEPFLTISLTSQWTSYKNHKALLANAGQEGEIYPYFKPFSNDELRKLIGVYMVYGLAPSPQVSMKFELQQEDDINGNDFIKLCMGPASVRRHNHFRLYFSTQCPIKPPQSQSSRTNWKIDPFLAWIKSISKKAWKPGKIISVYEQTRGFQGRNASKLRITYKKEGDGFQCDRPV